MKLSELNPEEQKVLMGLLRDVITADGDYSEVEKAEVAKLENELGGDAFVAAMTAAKTEYTSRAKLKEAAKGVTREEARKTIFDRLIKVASSDGVDDAEEKPLRWLAGAWPNAVS